MTIENTIIIIALEGGHPFRLRLLLWGMMIYGSDDDFKAARGFGVEFGMAAQSIEGLSAERTSIKSGSNHESTETCDAFLERSLNVALSAQLTAIIPLDSGNQSIAVMRRPCAFVYLVEGGRVRKVEVRANSPLKEVS